MNEIPRRLARNEDELPLFFQEDIRSAKRQRLARAVGHACERAHGTRHDDHGVEESGATGKGRVHGLVGVFGDVRGKLQLPNFLANDLLGEGRKNEVEFVLGRREMVQEALEVDCAACAGGCDDNAHGGLEKIAGSKHGAQAGRFFEGFSIACNVGGDGLSAGRFIHLDKPRANFR